MPTRDFQAFSSGFPDWFWNSSWWVSMPFLWSHGSFQAHEWQEMKMGEGSEHHIFFYPELAIWWLFLAINKNLKNNKKNTAEGQSSGKREYTFSSNGRRKRRGTVRILSDSRGEYFVLNGVILSHALHIFSFFLFEGTPKTTPSRNPASHAYQGKTTRPGARTIAWNGFKHGSG